MLKSGTFLSIASYANKHCFQKSKKYELEEWVKYVIN